MTKTCWKCPSPCKLDKIFVKNVLVLCHIRAGIMVKQEEAECWDDNEVECCSLGCGYPC